MYDIVIVGGGPAGIFASICAKERCSTASVLVLEQSDHLLAKVAVSGGGRCNITNSLIDPQRLSLQYPRGGRELIGPLSSFGPKETVAWFTRHNVPIVAERDGRMFPSSNSSKTVIQCLLQEAYQQGVEIRPGQEVLSIEPCTTGFHVIESHDSKIATKKLIVATGSHPTGYILAKLLGHTIIQPIPSLFPLRIDSPFLHSLSGTSLDKALLKIPKTPFSYEDALLITHFGLSGPCALKLSSKAARYLHEHSYTCPLVVNWLPEQTENETCALLFECKKRYPNRLFGTSPLTELNKTFWKAFVSPMQDICYKDMPHIELKKLAHRLHCSSYQIVGRGDNRQEFVTCGGVCLREVNFKTMQSRLNPNLFFAGEVLDIDALTGGFNLQNAWTTGYIAGTAAIF